jgi:hypothetical protein
LIAVLSAWLIGCSEDAGRQHIVAPTPFLPLDSDIAFQVYEAYGAPSDRAPSYHVIAQPRVAVWMRTTKAYDCWNYSIEHTSTVSANRVEVHLLGRSIGSVCLGTLGPARTAFFLDLDVGDYELVFHHENRSALFQLTVTDSSFVTSPPQDGFARSEFTEYYRYPPQSFAYYCGTTLATSWMCDDFVDRLLRSLRLEEISFSPPGQAPWPTQSDGHWHDSPARFFRYASEADYQAVGAALEQFTAETIGGTEGISLWTRSWRNEPFMSWLLAHAAQ